MQDSKQTYIDKYKIDYGTLYPEGHIIRLYEHFLKYEYNVTGENQETLLDFGCGNGTHTEYFRSKGFDAYGVDIIPKAITQAKARFTENESHFSLIDLYQSPGDVFEQSYDVIVCNQVLYYLDNDKLRLVIDQLRQLLKPCGLIYITMMGTNNHYWQKAKNAENGLSKVTLTGRLDETTYINFIHSESDLKDRFSQFTPEYLGYYDSSSREGSTFHYQFLGKKLTTDI